MWFLSINVLPVDPCLQNSTTEVWCHQINFPTSHLFLNTPHNFSRNFLKSLFDYRPIFVAQIKWVHLKSISGMVFCYQNCSDLLWEKIVLVIEKNFGNSRLLICKIFEITRTIYSNSERTEQFLVTECFFNLFLEVFPII